MEPLGDQLYQIFQEGYQRAASGSPVSGVPHSGGYNGSCYPPNPLGTNVGGEFSSVPQNFIQSSNWNPYPGGELEFPPNRGASFSGDHQQQIYNHNDYYGGTGLDINPTIGGFSPFPISNEAMQPDAFNPTTCIDYNLPQNYPAGPNVWPKQEHAGAFSRPNEADDIKGVFRTASQQDQPSNFFPDPTNNERMASAMTTPSPVPSSQPASPLSPTTSVSDSNFGESLKRKAPGSKSGPGSGRGKRKKTEEIEDPHMRLQKERERRVSNNSRERMRIRDINDALTELGRVCMSLRPSKPNADKPQTKLGVLNMAVEVIMQLEKKVRERNLNPSAVALNHRAPIPSSAASSSTTTFQAPFPPNGHCPQTPQQR